MNMKKGQGSIPMPKGAHLECKKLVYARTTEREVGGVDLLRRFFPPALGV